MKVTRSTLSTLITVLAVLILVAAIPAAVREALGSGRVYLLSARFLEELPQRLLGPGRMRFLLQPVVAIVLGCRSGLGDARAGRPAYLRRLFSRRAERGALLRSGLVDLRDLVALAIVLDAVSQWLIYKQVHPGAALVVGPVLISVPYALARALSRWLARPAEAGGSSTSGKT